MTEETLHLILQILGVCVSGSAIQLVIFLLRRRAEQRTLNAKADATTVETQTAYITTLHVELTALKDEISKARALANSERAALTDALDHSKREVDRITAQLGRAEADLAVARSQIAQLSTRTQLLPP